MSNRRPNKSPTMNTDFDDWETDPDFVKDMDEMDQRWGSKRTVGSINMNELIDEVRRDHKLMRDKFQHPSQRDHSEGFGGKFGIQHDRRDQSAHDYDYHEKLSKHTSQEISRQVFTSTMNSSMIKDGSNGGVSDAKRTFLEKTENTVREVRAPTVASKPDFGDRFTSKLNQQASKPPPPLPSSSTIKTSWKTVDHEPSRYEETSPSKRFVTKESSSTSPKGPSDMPQAFKSIQEKIDAFKKEFDDIENKVSKKSDLSRVIKKTTNVEKSNNVQYVSRESSEDHQPRSHSSMRPSDRPTVSTQNARPSSTSPLNRINEVPRTSIRSLSEKFETLCRDDHEEFKRRTEAKRKEFFDQIKNQVRETRKGLDGFDPIDDDSGDERTKVRSNKINYTSPLGSGQRLNSPRFTPSPSANKASSYLSSNSLSSNKPKVYTRSETTKEEIVSKVVKENDKVIENETKRNVERSSSCHGSSGDEEQQGHNRGASSGPTSIKLIDEELRSSPQRLRTVSPVDEIKRKIPIVEPDVKGAGLMARTLYDYKATEEDELSFDVDDLITNIEKIDPGWYKGVITRGSKRQEGLFPANHVKLLNDSDEY